VQWNGDMLKQLRVTTGPRLCKLSPKGPLEDLKEWEPISPLRKRVCTPF